MFLRIIPAGIAFLNFSDDGRCADVGPRMAKGSEMKHIRPPHSLSHTLIPRGYEASASPSQKTLCPCSGKYTHMKEQIKSKRLEAGGFCDRGALSSDAQTQRATP